MKVYVTGGRDYPHRHRVYETLDSYGPTLVVTGGCSTGADAYARSWCNSTGVMLLEVPALWSFHGKAAGPIRNRQMAESGLAEFCIAFPGGRGTANMVEECRKAGVPGVKVSQ